MKSFIITLSKISTSLTTALNLKQQLESYGMPAEMFEGTYGNDAVEQMIIENRTIQYLPQVSKDAFTVIIDCGKNVSS